MLDAILLKSRFLPYPIDTPKIQIQCLSQNVNSACPKNQCSITEESLMKAYLPPLLVILMLVAYLLHTNSCSCFRSTKPTISGSIDLKKVLNAASTEDNSVILTMLDHQNTGAASLLNLFLESFKLGIGTERFLNHLIILTTESRAFRYCKSVHHHCYNLPVTGRKKLLQSLEWRRNKMMEQVLDLGYSILYTDPNVLWLRNPFLHLHPTDVFAVAQKCINSTSEHRTDLPDGWFFYLKPEDVGIELLKFWNLGRVLYTNSDAHSALEVVQDWSVPEKGINLLDPVLFSSFCEGDVDMSRACIVRANCGAERDCHSNDLELLLSHWRNFTASAALNSE